MDPRTSTPGLGFAAWTVAVFGDKVNDYWKALKPNILTMAPGWSAGYGLFTSGEAPLVISYTTSPAYHVEYDKTDRYQALIFDEGHPMQVEGAGILKGAPNEAGAKKFMDFFITEEAQNTLPLTQWMYPANKNVVLPDSYKQAARVPAKTVSADSEKVTAALSGMMTAIGK
jgi:thiamine transport system substrate-binding protein